MDVADAFYQADARYKALQAELSEAKKERDRLEAQMLEIVERGLLPASFKHGKGSIYLHSQMWASAKDGDHEAVSRVLESLGLYEFLPSTVNSQKLSAFVREFRDELGQIKIGGDDGLPQELADVLNIRENQSVRATGN